MRGERLNALLLAAFLVACVSACTPKPSETHPDASARPAALPNPAPSSAVATSQGKATAPVRGAFRWDTHALIPGGTAEFFLDITPEVAVERVSVSVSYTGELELQSETPMALGALAAGEARAPSIRVRLSKPGKVELRAAVEGHGPDGEVLFQVSYPLYLILAGERILAGVDGFSALELTELERRKSAGDVTEEEYERTKRRIHGGGAHETITVTPPAAGAN